MTTLYLARHAETAANEARRLQGWVDGPDNQLLPSGRERALEAAAFLCDKPLDAVYVSPLGRARETARLLCAGRAIPWVFAPRLREIHFGQAEMRPMSEWVEHTKKGDLWREFSYSQPFPQGESYLDLWARTTALLADVLARHAGERVLLVSHASPVKFQLAALCGLSPEESVHRFVPNAALYELHGEALGAFRFSRLYPPSAAESLDF